MTFSVDTARERMDRWLGLCVAHDAEPLVLIAVTHDPPPHGKTWVFRSENGLADDALANLIAKAALRLMEQSRRASGGLGPPT